MLIPDRVYERLLRNADRDEPSGCLISRYSLGSHGYAQIGWTDLETGRSIVTLAHRAVWIHERGELDEGMTVDHRQGLCSKSCIELTHLRELTNFENGRRQQGRDWPLGQCARGHSNNYLVKRKRGLRCLLCEREDTRAYRARRR